MRRRSGPRSPSPRSTSAPPSGQRSSAACSTAPASPVRSGSAPASWRWPWYQRSCWRPHGPGRHAAGDRPPGDPCGRSTEEDVLHGGQDDLHAPRSARPPGRPVALRPTARRRPAPGGEGPGLRATPSDRRCDGARPRARACSTAGPTSRRTPRSASSTSRARGTSRPSSRSGNACPPLIAGRSSSTSTGTSSTRRTASPRSSGRSASPEG